MTKVITEIIKGETDQYYPLGKHVVRAVGVCGGRPTLKYTRIEIAGTLDGLAAGESLDEIVAGYRGRVSREAIIEAIQIVTAGFLRTLPELEPGLMLVLDEQLLGRNLETALGHWYRGPVRFITDLRPGTVIKDDAMPVLLRQQQHATFLTINEADFWRKVGIDAHFCVVCFALPDSRAREIPNYCALSFGSPRFEPRHVGWRRYCASPSGRSPTTHIESGRYEWCHCEAVANPSRAAQQAAAAAGGTAVVCGSGVPSEVGGGSAPAAELLRYA